MATNNKEDKFKTYDNKENKNVDKNEQENMQLKQEVSELKGLVNQLLVTQKIQQEQSKVNIKEKETKQVEEITLIDMNKPIRVMSLTYGGLNLKTANEGNMSIFRFDEFGSSLPILYSDLVRIINNQPKLTKQGYYVILDKNVVKLHFLEKYYNKFLDKETIDNILNFDDDKIEQLFKNTTKQIQQTIVDLIIEKIVKNEYVDRNKVKIISELYGQDLFQLADNLK